MFSLTILEKSANPVLDHMDLKTRQIERPTNIPNCLKELNIHINRMCNVKCQMCGHWQDTEANRKELKFKSVIDVISDSQRIGCEKIIFNGGEPTLRKDLVQMLYHAKELGMKTELRTNGSKLNRSFVKELAAAELNTVSMSFDSPIESIHDEIRGNKGLYQKMLTGIRLMHDEAPKIKIRTNCTIMKNNYKELDQMIDFAEKYKMENVTLQMVRSHSSFGEYHFVEEQKLRLTETQMREFYTEIAVRFYRNPSSVMRLIQPLPPNLYGGENAYIADRLENLKDHSFFKDFSLELYGKHFVESNFCCKPTNRTEIDAEGNVYTCCSVNAKMMVMGNIYEENLIDIWESEKYKKFRWSSTTPRNKVCLTCPSYQKWQA